MNTFALALSGLITIASYIALFYFLYKAYQAGDANLVLSVKYLVLAAISAVYICWMDLAMKMNKLQTKVDAKDIH